MRRVCKIKQVGTLREGEGQYGKWFRTPVVVEWTEREINAEPYLQTAVIEVKGKLNMAKVQDIISQGTEIEISFFFSTLTAKNGNVFIVINGYLPKELFEAQM